MNNRRQTDIDSKLTTADLAGETVIARLATATGGDSWRGQGNSGIVRNDREEAGRTAKTGNNDA